MSKKIIAFSFLSLCLVLCGCWQQNNNTENQCIDDTCINNPADEAKAPSKTTSEIESDIAGFTENSGEVQVAEKLDWEPIVVDWGGRDL